MRMTVLARLALTLAVLATTVGVPAAPAGGTPCGSSEVRLHTLHIEAIPSKKKVHRGESFKVEITATRPAHEDPAGQGIEFEPPVSVPAADIPIWITVFVGKYTYFWDIGMTDENGKDTLNLTVPKNSEPGRALAIASGKKYHWQVCPELVEEGYAYYTDFVKVVR